ncbi:MAG: ADP-ribose pyrophosphatase [candidate division WS6 bacterium OLB20]|uniref:ADP-ribose pyrophosphatase n=1 Tax=candidate division WS6 bacterium OLB20 TaxID=1617426 RepID=A0A136LW58_9BACT|nr:MAG: ADP-ribose pyrophosphatase [candidate division WS6 bacterium OLB20]
MTITRPAPRHTIGPDAARVFDGVIFDVWQWQQQLYDGTKTTFELLKRDDTVLVVAVTEQKTILLLEQEQPGKKAFTGVPGGRVDEGEDPLAAAKRELQEETGYTTDTWELWDAWQPLSKLDWAIYLFIARDVKLTDSQKLDSGEKISITELSYDDFIRRTYEEGFADIEISLKTMRAALNGREDELRKLILG